MNSNGYRTGDNLNYGLDYEYYDGYAHRAERIGTRYYRYDANGNVTMERDGGHAQTLEYEYGDPHYDPERNVWSTDYGFALQDPNYVRDGNNTTFQRTYEWNERNLLKRSRDQQYTVHYRYGVDGQRAVKFTEQNNKEQLYFNKMYQLSSGEGFSGNWVERKHIYVGETRIVAARNEAGNDNTAYQERNRFF